MKSMRWPIIAGSVLVASLLALTLDTGPGRGPRAVQKSEAETQLEFGVKVARMGSWREAAFRFERAVRADGTNARAYNNLAVALENLGRFEEAKRAYEKAIELGPDSKHIRQNHERFMSYYRSTRGAGR
jgi:Flp pilus assembly protein TadD